VEGNGVLHPTWQTFPSGRCGKRLLSDHLTMILHFGVNHAPRSFCWSRLEPATNRKVFIPALTFKDGAISDAPSHGPRSACCACCNMGRCLREGREPSAARSIWFCATKWSAGLQPVCCNIGLCLRIDASNMLAVRLGEGTVTKQKAESNHNYHHRL
jgi:hypothetical protein